MANYKLRVSDTLKQERLEQVERHFRRMERISGEVREVITEEEDLEEASGEEVVIEEGLEGRDSEEFEGTITNIGGTDSSLGEIIEGKK